MRPPGADSSGFTVIEDQLAFLPLPKGMNNARALSINDSGVAVGWWGNFITGDPVAREAFVWPPDGEAFGLHGVHGVTLSEAHDINDSGRVVGSVYAQYDQRAFILDGGRAKILPPIPGGLSSNARAVNEWGDVVGDGRLPPTTPGTIDHAGFVYIDGSFHVIEAPRQFNRASARDINRFRQVVGNFEHSLGAATPETFIWQHGRVALLSDLITGPLPNPANVSCCINDLGQIVMSNRNPQELFEPAKLVLTPRDRPVGDIDIDCRVDQRDLAFLLGRWGCPDQAADLDDDGLVGFADLTMLLANWRPVATGEKLE